ncbi:MAG: ATP-dependent Clp protease ATP-binding subunit, partial [Spirochaetaceae bacterium]|nr:ATP-dependent Clp protease ATP-binding subunit [Spirochaetaceae bacterium]
VVTSNDIKKVLAIMTGIPLENIDTSESAKLINMEAELHKTVVGQDEAVSLISSAIRRSRSGISSVRRPLGSFIFLGPTGVGKTLLAKTLAKFLFGTEDSLIRIDMSDYMEKHNASRLVGAPPGYVGYEEGGVLTEKVRKNPYSVVLLDEIEKAHPDVFNLLLQVLEEGELKDSLGHAVNFKNTVIIMTSNAGARQITTDSRVGFSSLDSGLLEYEDIKSNALAELKKLLSPELLNRIDDTVVFTALSKEEVAVILHIQLKELESRLAEQGLSLAVRPAACDYLVENGYDPQYGARPMRRLIQRNIEDPLSIKLLSGEAEGKSSVIIDYKNDEFVVSFKKSPKRKNTEKANEIESVLV